MHVMVEVQVIDGESNLRGDGHDELGCLLYR